MRLLRVSTLEFSSFPPDEIPKYAILSHKWGREESSFQEATRKHNDDVEKEGYKKVKDFAEYVMKSLPHVKWIWIDTCCINQESSAELTEAIISMYKWYSGAEVCFAYLAGATRRDDLEEFKGDEWFRRGWTLQELIAPATVVFLTRTWEVIGHKGKTGRCRSGIDLESGPVLTAPLVAVTGIPKVVLDDFKQSRNLGVEERLAWADGRKTTRDEDMSYCLLGIFDVGMSARYGEGGEHARTRLFEAIDRASGDYEQKYLSTRLAKKDTDQFRKIEDWLSAPDPRVDHKLARQKHQAKTGIWLLESNEYQGWKHSSSGHLWLRGKPGCGKTVLCSSVVEDVKTYCEARTSIGHAIFYFSFSDDMKQSYEYFLRSLVAQLGWAEPGLTKLRQARENLNASVPAPHELEEILVLAIKSYEKFFFLMDGARRVP